MTTDKARLRILMLGEALERPGGVVTVEKATLSCAPERLDFHHIATLPPDDPFGPFRKLITLIGAMAALILKLVPSRVDIVHIHVSMGASIPRKCLLAQIAFLFGKPVVMHTHGGEFAKQFPDMPTWLQTFIRRTFQQCDAVITLAETWRCFYVDTLGIDPSRALILKNPVTLPAIPPPTPPAPPVQLLYLGMLSAPKGAFDLIEAIAGIDEAKRQKLHLTMAGHGQLEEARTRVANANLGETIELRGWINADERDDLLKKTHIFVLPSHYEGLPMALLEAMSFGLSPIATPVGGIPDVLNDGENGLLVPVEEPKRLANAILRLVEDDGLRCRLGQAARSSVEPYSAEGYAETLIEIYQSLLEDSALVRA
jgi:glycosyltransferase involved in cell wall biosynthesis